MTTSVIHSLPEPPRWAQTLLASLLPPDRADDVSGDLLEQYRERVLPRLGRARADRWYVKQTFGFRWRLCAPFALVIAAAVIARTVVDAFVPIDTTLPRPYEFRSAVTTYTAISTYLAAGCWSGFRTRSVSTGAAVTFFSHVAGHLIAIAVMLPLYAAAIDPNASSLTAFQVSGGWGEQIVLPIVMLPPVGVLGVVGAAMGKLLARLPRASVMSR